jgi:hypothetical protein
MGLTFEIQFVVLAVYVLRVLRSSVIQSHVIENSISILLQRFYRHSQFVPHKPES